MGDLRWTDASSGGWVKKLTMGSWEMDGWMDGDVGLGDGCCGSFLGGRGGWWLLPGR